MTAFDAEVLALATRVIEANADVGRTVALAESCTGGLVGAALTEVPGSSRVFLASLVVYANDAKTRVLGVPTDIIETFGAVSTATAWSMAKGALDLSGADVAVAITGVAGPGGGTAHNPVGTVVFARAIKGQAAEDYLVKREHFDAADRTSIRRQATLVALTCLLPDDPSSTVP